MSKMENDNSIEYNKSDDDERVEIDPRDVRKMNEPICVIKLPNGNYKQPTKKEIKLLEEKGISNPCLGNVSLKKPTEAKEAAKEAAKENTTAKESTTAEEKAKAKAKENTTAKEAAKAKENTTTQNPIKEVEIDKDVLQNNPEITQLKENLNTALLEQQKKEQREKELEEENKENISKMVELLRNETKRIQDQREAFTVIAREAADIVAAKIKEKEEAEKEAAKKKAEEAEKAEKAAEAIRVAAEEAEKAAEIKRLKALEQLANTGYSSVDGPANTFMADSVIETGKNYETDVLAKQNYKTLTDQQGNEILKKTLTNKTDIENFLNKVIELRMVDENKITDIMLNTIILEKLKENIDISSNSIQDTTFDVSYNGISKQVSYTKGNEVNKSFSFTESSSTDSSNEFTVENIKKLFTKVQGGSKKYNKKYNKIYNKINLKLRKTTLKKRKGKKYNKKRYTIRKKSLTRNKVKSRSSKTKKQKRGIKKPRYTKRRY